jgi:hypothetical protein
MVYTPYTQTSADVNGANVACGGYGKTDHQASDNLETVLKVSGLSLANVVRLNFYTTNIGAFYNDAVPTYHTRLEAAGGLQKSMRIGDIVVCDRAIWDEGTSHHYLSAAKYAHACPTLTAGLIAA